MTVYDGKIYCIGGTNNVIGASLSSVECYGPVTNMWTSLTPMPTARGSLGAATLNGKIYAIGGIDYYVALDTVEIYDSQLDEWYTMTSMNYARGCGLGLTCINEKLYVFGGARMDNAMMRGAEKSIECFDPTLDEWLVIPGTEVSCWGVWTCRVAMRDDGDHSDDQSELVIAGGIDEFTEEGVMLRVTVKERQIICEPFQAFHSAMNFGHRIHRGAVSLHLPPGL